VAARSGDDAGGFHPLGDPDDVQLRDDPDGVPPQDDPDAVLFRDDPDGAACYQVASGGLAWQAALLEGAWVLPDVSMAVSCDGAVCRRSAA